MAGYDPNKAQVFNKLRQQGLSEEAAAAQAGISDAEAGNYAVGDNGQMGPVLGFGTGTQTVAPTAAEQAESARFEAGLSSPSNFEQVDYAQTAQSNPGTVKPITYTTTSTETVSGGGSTTVVGGFGQPNAESRAIGTAYDAKNAEYNQFVKDNPSDFARKKQGLPPLTPEEKVQRQEKLDQLNQEKEALKKQQLDAQTPTPGETITEPNTTTTTTTVTSETVNSNQPVNEQNDEQLFNQTETQLGSTVPTAPTEQATAVSLENDPYETARLAAESQETPTALTPEDVGDEDPFEASRLEREQELNREEAAAVFGPEPVGNDFGAATQDEARAIEEAELARVREEEAAAVFGPAAVPPQFAGTNGAAYDDDGNLMPGYSLDENGNPVYVGGDFVEPATAESAAASRQAAKESQLREQFTIQQRNNTSTQGDWRVRIRLAPGATYLYKAPAGQRGILEPLVASDGVIFPYTPTISTSYQAKYDSYNLTHSNYRGYFYQGSQVGDISINGIFTAQDTTEAQYLLAVIHFFRSVTKMFYGKDQFRGAPPPIVELSGFGQYQFNNHPCLVAGFNYSLPKDVDYIQIQPNNQGLNLGNRQPKVSSSPSSTLESVVRRLASAGLPQGGQASPQDLGVVVGSVNGTSIQTTYVPTKIEIAITLHPLQTRQQVSQGFSLENFANGNLLKGGFW